MNAAERARLRDRIARARLVETAAPSSRAIRHERIYAFRLKTPNGGLRNKAYREHALRVVEELDEVWR